MTQHASQFTVSEVFSQSKLDKPDSTSSYNNLAFGVVGVLCLPALLVILFVVIANRAYKTTFQRLILYYIFVGLFVEFSFGLLIKAVIGGHTWECMVVFNLYFYLFIVCYVYITVVTNYSLIQTLCILSRSPKFHKKVVWVECICITSAAVLPALYIWLPIRDSPVSQDIMLCEMDLETNATKQWYEDVITFNSILFVMSAEVVIICLVMCVTFCYIHQRIQYGKVATMLRNSLFLTIINATIMGLTLLYTAYAFYQYFGDTTPSQQLSEVVNITVGVCFPLALMVSILFQSVLSIRTAKGIQCCKSHCLSSRDKHSAVSGAATNPTSHPLNLPSSTESVSAPYTDGFKSMHCEGEKIPLIKKVSKTQFCPILFYRITSNLIHFFNRHTKKSHDFDNN